jgi:ferredoxin--NADP+ reductase
MTHVILHGCCSDSACIPACPVQCIRPRPGDADFATAEQLYIDPDLCIDCGACLDECPVDAIETEWDLPNLLTDYIGINAAYFATHPIEKSPPPDVTHRRLPVGSGPLSVAIVGSGPAACYAATELSDVRGVSVTVIERLPTPFGLVRAGVAPDHSHTKLIGDRFDAVLARPNVQCFFNVEVGRDVTVEQLLEHHHAVIWAGGADSDRSLGIPGEGLPGSFAAREFVAWYNGHPDHADSTFDLSCERVVVLGNGNVALDVARVLARPVAQLRGTDMADHALDALAASSVREVVVVGRRGPQFAACTSGELAALEGIDGLDLLAVAEDLAGARDGGDADRRLTVLESAAARAADPAHRSITFRFGLAPVSVNGTDRVESVTFARPDGSTETVEAGLVLRAIGYRGREVAGLPFDNVTGTLPHEQGRVVDPGSGLPVEGVYCSGWIKRGATGIIGSNRVDAAETVEALFQDFEGGRLQEPRADATAFAALIATQQPAALDKGAWRRIDEAERQRGKAAARPRTKFVSVDELLRSAAPAI